VIINIKNKGTNSSSIYIDLVILGWTQEGPIIAVSFSWDWFVLIIVTALNSW